MGPLYTRHIQTLFPRPIIYKQKENKYDLKCFATVTQNTRKCVKLIPQIELRKSFHYETNNYWIKSLAVFQQQWELITTLLPRITELKSALMKNTSKSLIYCHFFLTENAKDCTIANQDFSVSFIYWTRNNLIVVWDQFNCLSLFDAYALEDASSEIARLTSKISVLIFLIFLSVDEYNLKVLHVL